MTDHNKTPNKKNNLQGYLGVAIVFFAGGIVFMISESTRVTGIPFMVLGFMFFILSQQKTKDKD